jgi:hypothetical protein
MMVAGSWIHAIWIASLIGVLLMTIFGTDAVRRQASDVYFMRALGMMAVGLLMYCCLATRLSVEMRTDAATPRNR